LSLGALLVLVSAKDETATGTFLKKKRPLAVFGFAHGRLSAAFGAEDAPNAARNDSVVAVQSV
jgi:hypothetical protein